MKICDRNETKTKQNKKWCTFKCQCLTFIFNFFLFNSHHVFFSFFYVFSIVYKCYTLHKRKIYFPMSLWNAHRWIVFENSFEMPFSFANYVAITATSIEAFLSLFFFLSSFSCLLLFTLTSNRWMGGVSFLEFRWNVGLHIHFIVTINFVDLQMVKKIERITTMHIYIYIGCFIIIMLSQRFRYKYKERNTLSIITARLFITNVQQL